ncbi:hypothetical protein AYM40_29600 [Paraburkholderia phytofirmans OLGA172]|uniref:OmpR/PhoB-type domain-containing protein n=1 Tax=Paraburkholderia phytofirmans OLGA172 TaxID=1417228 RepID=A0A160FTN9_9BURK|nr:hypothetical protein AYM40_29600 [Paraburkholderia phytofirmans OLGA172]
MTKDELIRHVWPDTIVEENNLQVHLSALRKALGADRDLIVTLTGRGYQLAGRPANTLPPGEFEIRHAQASFPCATDDVPLHAAELFGRKAVLQDIAEMLLQTQTVTLVGAGGIGKTSLATAVALHFKSRFQDGVYFAGLAGQSDASAVLVAVADACHLTFAGGEVTAARIAFALANKRCLVVLDNAEHVIDVVANLTEVLTRHNPLLRVLATSREPLRVPAESVYRVQPLEVPASDAQLEEVLTHSAVRLFLHRARALQPGFGRDAASISLVAEVCRRLDGIPLAIELAAARAATLGIDGLHRRLDDRLKVLTGGCRTSLPRHQTLRATFDWSYALLDPAVRAVFRRLSRFADSFSVEDACAIAVDNRISPTLVVTGISELVEKSLLGIEFGSALTRYRLAESTRAYAREKLHDEGEDPSVAAAHARWLQQRFGRERRHVPIALTGEAHCNLRDALDDARSALDWALSPEGDELLGVELTGMLVEPLLAWSLIQECCTRAGRAVAVLEQLPAETVDVACELRLRAALASALLLTCGPVSEAANLWIDVLSLATEQHDEPFQAHSLWGLFNATLSSGRIHTSLRYAMLLQTFANERGEDSQRTLADQMVGVSRCWLGEHADARALVEGGLAHLRSRRQTKPESEGFRVDPMVVANGTLARVLWVQGHPEQAMALIESTIKRVSSDMQEPSLSQVLGGSAIPLALLSGDLPTAAHYLDMLRKQATVHRLEVWQECCDCLTGHLDILNGRPEIGLPMLDAGLAALQMRGFRTMQISMVGSWAEALAHAGDTVEARRVLVETLAYCNENGNHLFSPDFWRILGLVSSLEACAAAARGASPIEHETEAQASFLHAIELAQQQGARMWELRAAIPLAQLWISQQRHKEAIELLDPLCATFTHPGASLDVRTGCALLVKLKDINAETEAARSHDGFARPRNAQFSEDSACQ